jgi:DNA-binding XRE family transcriptional regulator
MLTREALASRLREARQKKGMTLKEVERLSGFSSTHVSEIERGRTTPTIDALVRIARALSQDPCYFVEEQELGEVSVTSAGLDPARSACGGAVEVCRLSPGVLGGRLEFSVVRAGQPFRGRLEEIGPGDICFYVTEGAVRVSHEEEVFFLETGTSLHAHFRAPPEVAIEAPPVEIIVIADPSGGCEQSAARK